MKYYKFDFQRGCFKLHFPVWKIKPILLNWLTAENKPVGGKGSIFWLSRLLFRGMYFWCSLGKWWCRVVIKKKSNITFSYIWQLPDWNPILIGAAVQLLCGYPKVGVCGFLFVCFVFVLLKASLCARHTVRPNNTKPLEFGAEKGLLQVMKGEWVAHAPQKPWPPCRVSAKHF